MWKRLAYPIFGALLLGGYSTAVLLDWDPFGGTERSQLPAEARSSPGAYRAPIFWTGAGFSGGK